MVSAFHGIERIGDLTPREILIEVHSDGSASVSSIAAPSKLTKPLDLAIDYAIQWLETDRNYSGIVVYLHTGATWTSKVALE